MGELLKSLGLDGRVFLIQLVGFAALFFLLKRFLFGPVTALLASRQEDIQESYNQAEQNKKAMETLKAEYEQRISEVEAEARTRIQQAIKEAQSAKEEIVNEAREQSHQIIQRGQQEIEHERDRALAALRSEVAGLAVGAAGKILGENLDETRHRKLVDDFINQIGRA